MISFIIPAHNEELFIGHCIAQIQAVIAALKLNAEIIVVDDSSNDSTAAIAERLGSRLVKVNCRQISAARNAGGGAATGDILFFVDADTLVNGVAINSSTVAMRDGAVGGGCIPMFDEPLPFWFRAINPIFVLILHMLGQPGGSCLFCTKKAFEITGGFSEKHFAAEDALFISALKKQGKTFIPSAPVLTSGRNLRVHSAWTFCRLLTRLALRGPKSFQSRVGLDFWYKPRR